MAATSLLCHLHFWTIQPLSPAISTGSSHIAVHSYQPKGLVNKLDTELCRRYWSEGRGISWYLSNQRPNKLRDNLREVEELLSSQRIICLQWKTLRHFILLLESGIIVIFTVAKHSGDIEGIMIDRSLIPRLQGKIDKVLFLNDSLVLLYTEGNRVVYLTPPPRRVSLGEGPTALTLTHEKLKKKIEKISSIDLRYIELEIKGIPDHTIERHMLTNSQQDLLVIWWSDLIQDNGLLWSGMAGGEHTNMCIIKFKSNGKLELLTKLQTSSHPITVFFRQTGGNVLYVFGRHHSEEYTYELSIVDCTDRKSVRQSLHYTTETTLTIDTQVKVCSSNNDESLLAIGCESGLIVLFDIKRDSVKTSRAFFSSISSISWHPAGTVLFVCGSKGEIQCLDCALNSLSFMLPSEIEITTTPLLELGSLCMFPLQLEHTGWASLSREGEGHSGCYDNFVMVFSQGPIVLLRIELGVFSKGRLTAGELIVEYLRHGQLQQSISLLLSLNWDIHPQASYDCLTVCTDHLLSLPSTPYNEELIEQSLSSFYANGLSQKVLNEFRPSVHLIARRFFFRLLRSGHFEKAFRLAVELSSKDLFMELHYTALDRHDIPLAELSLKKAEQLSQVEQSSTSSKKKSVEKTDSVSSTKSSGAFAMGVVTEKDHVIRNPSAVDQRMLESSTESTHLRILRSSSNESSHSSMDFSKRKSSTSSTSAWSGSSARNKVNIINFNYF